MEISNSYLAAYEGGPVQRPDGAPSGGARRQPTEQVLEGELLNDRRQRERPSVEAQRQAHQRYYEQVQQVKSTSPQAARALQAYLSSAAIGAAGLSDYPYRLDVYA